MITLKTEDFEQEVKVPGLVLVDFFTTSCAPCRVLAPVFQRSAEKHPDVKHLKAEPSESSDLFVRFGVNYVPTLILFKDGQEISRKGPLSESELSEWLAKEKV